MSPKYKHHYASMTDNDALFHMVINECFDYSDGNYGSEITSLEDLMSLLDWTNINKLYNRDMYKVIGYNSQLTETLIDWVGGQLIKQYNHDQFGV